jgi:limonene-1,2-epoxide hydrolase
MFGAREQERRVPDIERTLREFIGEWGKSLDAIIAAFNKYLVADAVWEQRPLPTAYSVEQAISLLKTFQNSVGMETFGAEILNLAVQGNVAFAERIDHVRRADGSLLVSVPVTGVFEFNRNGKITAWREYFDATGSLRAMGLPDPTATA